MTELNFTGIYLFKADGERLRLEREAMEGFVSPGSHTNVKKQLMDMKASLM